ncbi:hypothetical protein [Geothrix edaphica]|uniref:DUF2339 domain-containing protein n=1 Tax=Geothrix edaphica TaxID=2927976 RepID=A0ABQ5PWA3_9BACT|nr:hypothetical protein [Geothrix edaphica]GLH66341.1 hypothetical protein GETHED_07050 [Geothrix edaphica]
MSTAQVPPLKAAPGEAPPAGLESRLAALAEVVRDLEARVGTLEAARPPASALTPAPTPAPGPLLEEAPLLDAALPSPTRILGLVGRVCLILGGAYLIRALVDAGTVPRGVGVALGLAYAATWAILGHRARRPLDAAFPTLASILIAYPLLVEASTRFGILAPGLAALLLVAVAVLHAAVAWRRDLHATLWTATLAALGSGFLVMMARRSIEPFAAAFLALGAGALWLTYGRRWHGLRWPTALAADAGILILTVLAAWPGGPGDLYRGLSLNRALFLALALAAVYIGSFAVRMLQRRRVVNAFEIIQTALVLLVGFGGAVRVALASGSGTALLGAGISLAGVGCYAAALPFADDQDETRANFNFFTFLALVFLLLGGPFVLPLPVFATLSGVLGLAAMVAALRLRRKVLVLQSGLYLVTSALASGLGSWALHVFMDSVGPTAPATSAGLASLLALFATLAYFLLRRPPDPVTIPMRPAILVLGALAAAGLGAVAIWACCGGRTPEPGGLALARTLVLSALAIALAWLGRRVPVLELRWMVYPLLAVTTLKFLFEDMAVGRPLTLFLAFMGFGTTLILAPRLLRNPAAQDVDEDSEDAP